MANRSLRSARRTKPQEARLCNWCRTLDLDAIFRRRHATVAGRPVRKRRRSGTSFNADSCPLCNLIVKTFGTPKLNSKAGYQLYSYSTRCIKDRGWASIDTVMLSLKDCDPDFQRVVKRETRFLFPQAKGAEVVRIVPPNVEMGLLREWVDHCRQGHTMTCGLAAEDMAPLSEISSFRIIDCRTGKLIPWSGQHYATLSYVWGGGSASPLFAGVLSIKELPATIQDAMTVALALDLGYIWVDRYCINQQDDDEKREQFHKMDLIYNCSSATIVNAAGQGAGCGLLGVGRPRANQQPQARIGNRLLVSTLIDPKHDIEKSEWWTRGWTYQEGVLARRRVIFTKRQVYFECGGMYCCEALGLDLSALHTLDGQRFKAQYWRNKINLGLFSAQLGRSGWEVTERIKEYSSRALTDERDILHGLRGVLGALEKSTLRLRHLFGVPVLPRGPKPRKTPARSDPEWKDNQELYESMQWTPTVGLCVGLCWEVDRPMERRQGFPSWSWAGWKSPVKRPPVIDADTGLEIPTKPQWTAPVKWALSENAWPLFQGNQALVVFVEVDGSRRIRLDKFVCDEGYQHLSNQLSPVLHILTSVTPVFIVSWPDQGAWEQDCREKPTCVAKVEGKDGGLLDWKFTPTSITPMTRPSASHIAIVLGKDVDPCKSAGPYVLVAAEVEEGVYERVGFGVWNQNTLRDSKWMKKEALWTFHTAPHHPVARVLKRFRLR